MNTPFLFKNTLKLAFVASALFFTSCTDEELPSELENTETTPNEYSVTVTPENENTEERTIQFTALANSTTKVSVNFTGTKNMDRLYMTKNTFSSNIGPVPYFYELGNEAISKKKDGSIDLDGDNRKSFNFAFNLEAPTKANDVVQYIIWTTTERGDFRDVNNDNAVADDAYATITITAGTGFEVTGIKEFTQTILAAPLGSGTSETFVSIFNNQTYAINQGAETAALWDFGYFYGNTTRASFYSASDFPKVFLKDGAAVNVATFSGASASELNKCYFKLSDKTAAEFDAISTKADLDFIMQSASERVQYLSKDKIVEFVDQYGNKGLIKVLKVEGTNGSNGKITFTTKVQVNAEPIKL